MSKNREDVLIHTFSPEFVNEIDRLLRVARTAAHKLEIEKYRGSLSCRYEYDALMAEDENILKVLETLRGPTR